MRIFVKNVQFLNWLHSGLSSLTKSEMVAIFGLSIKNGDYFEIHRVSCKKAITLLTVGDAVSVLQIVISPFASHLSVSSRQVSQSLSLSPV